MNVTKIAALSLVFVAPFLHGQQANQQHRVPSRGVYATIDTTGMKLALAVFAGADESAKDALLARITKSPGDCAPPIFLLVAQRLWAKGDREGAYFWFCFGRLRGRYDAARCADATARGGIDTLVSSVAPEIRSCIAKMHPDRIVPFAQKVVQVDRATPYNYDHRWISLHGLGAVTEGKVELCLPEARWPALLAQGREALIAGAEKAAEHFKPVKKE